MSAGKLRTELLTDPLGLDYAGMSDAAAAASLTDEAARSLADLALINSADLYEAVQANDYLALDDIGKDQVRVLLALGGEIRIHDGSKARNNLLNLFPAGTGTRTNLIELVTGRTQSRQQELGISGVITAQRVNAARMPDQPETIP